MAVPARRTSKTAKRKRRTNIKLSAPTMSRCSHCGAPVEPHHVCKKCGYYNGKKILDVKTDAE